MVITPTRIYYKIAGYTYVQRQEERGTRKRKYKLVVSEIHGGLQWRAVVK